MAAVVTTASANPHQRSGLVAPDDVASRAPSPSSDAPAPRVAAFAEAPTTVASTPPESLDAGEVAAFAPAAGRLVPPRRMMTQWRLPSRPGKMPVYVKDMFRLKALSLLCSQLLVVLGIMLAIEVSGLASEWDRSMSAGILIFFIAMAVVGLIALKYCMDVFPTNYCLLAVVTLLAGFVWGVGGQLLPAQMHFQVMGVVTGAMVFSTMSIAVLARARLSSSKSVFGSVIFGWIVAAVADAIIAQHFGIDQMSIVISVFVALGLFVVFGWEAGQLLVDCNPDSFMSVVIAMDASLLVVLSIPFLWAVSIGLFVSCWLLSPQAELPGDERA